MDNFDSEDIDLVDYLINLKNTTQSKVCVECGRRETPQWRHGPFIGQSSKRRILCNPCGIVYRKRVFGKPKKRKF